MIYLDGMLFFSGITPGGGNGLQNNFTAIVDPTVTDDSAAGYSVGSQWVNTTTDSWFVCVDASVGAAVWLPIAPGGVLVPSNGLSLNGSLVELGGTLTKNTAVNSSTFNLSFATDITGGGNFTSLYSGTGLSHIYTDAVDDEFRIDIGELASNNFFLMNPNGKNVRFTSTNGGIQSMSVGSGANSSSMQVQSTFGSLQAANATNIGTVRAGTSNAILSSTTVANGDGSTISATPTTLTMQWENAAFNGKFIQINNGSMSVGDNVSNRGLQYVGDYSANFVARSLIDKGWLETYVDAGSGNGQMLYWDVSTSTYQHTGNSAMKFDSLQGTLSLGNSNPDNSAILELTSTSQGILIPRMTGAQILAITTPANGLKVINTDNDIEYKYDAARGAWLSTETITLAFGGSGATTNEYLDHASVGNSGSGHKLLRDANLVGVTVQTSGGDATKGFELHTNGAASGYSFSLAGGVFSDATVDVELTGGDYLGMFAVLAGTPSQNPVVSLQIKWRL